jgi:pimeloyl-ACP methyl ester carboxylesterase
VVVFCHGLGGSHLAYSELGAHLATHGYVVLHPQFADAFELVAPALGLSELGPDEWARDERARAMMHAYLFDPLHWVSRVARVHAILDSLSERRYADLCLRAERVMVGGHSFGAYTAQLLLGVRVVNVGLDDRVLSHPAAGAGLLMSPQGSGDRGLVEESWNDVRTPILEITATRDRGPHGEGLDWRRQPFDCVRSDRKYLAVIKDADHSLGGIARPAAHAGDAHAAAVRRALGGLVVAFGESLEGSRAAGEWLASGPEPDLFDHYHEEAS